MNPVYAYWSQELGCRPADFDSPGTRVVAHRTGYAGASALYRPGVFILSVPPRWLERAERALGDIPPGEVDQARLRAVFGGCVERVVGPAYLGYLSPEVCRDEAADDGIRALTPNDRSALEALRAACAEIEWEHAGAALEPHGRLGLFEDGALIALGSAEEWGFDLVHLGLLTHPAHRGRGLGRRMARALTAQALRGGKTHQYRALISNEASLAVARSVGYVEWARTLFVRLAG